MLFLSLIYLAFISLGLPDSLLGSSWPLMQPELGVAVNRAGYVSVIVSLGTIISSLFSHRLIRRFGTGKVTVVSVSMTAVALLGFSLTPSFWWLLLFAVPLGLGAGAVDSGLNEFVAEHFEARHMNWLHCFWGIGAMLGPILIATLTNAGFSWRKGYLSISILQFVLVALLLFSLPMWKARENRPTSNASADALGKQASKHSLFSPLTIKGAPFAMLSFFLYSSIESTINLWGASYLVNQKNVAPEAAAGYVSLFFLGITIGRLISGFVSFKVNNDALITIGTGVVLAGALMLLLPLPGFFTVLAYIIIGTGLAPVFPSLLHQTPVYFGSDNAQATMGLQMAFAYTGVTLMPPLFGQLFSNLSFALLPWIMLVCSILLIFFTAKLRSTAQVVPAEA